MTATTGTMPLTGWSGVPQVTHRSNNYAVSTVSATISPDNKALEWEDTLAIPFFEYEVTTTATEQDVLNTFGEYFEITNAELDKAINATKPVINKLTKYIEKNDGRRS